MDNLDTSRRLRFKDHPPEHFCAVCRTILYQDEPQCVECQTSKPPEGWLRCDLIPNLLLGQILDGRYLVVKHVGRGAFADVYSVLSLTIMRLLAIKVVDLNALDSKERIEAERRLRREIDILGRLNNPHIVSVSDVFFLGPERRLVSIVTNFIPGQNLKQVVSEQGALSLPRTYNIVQQIIVALSSAHEAMVIHRDLKPENVMVEPLDFGGEFVHLLDFGMALAQDYNRSSLHFVGTPLFASPEQATGRALDHRSDLYSLGALICFLLTGSPPFKGAHLNEVISQLLHQPPPRLSELAPWLTFPKTLETLTVAMLSKHPQDRPALYQVRATIASLAEESLPHQPSSLHVAQTPAAPSLQVLIVEPEAHTRELLATLVAAKNFEVHLATEASQALELFLELMPDLIILSIELPEQSGLELCAKIRSFSMIPLVVLASDRHHSDVVSAFHYGADDFIIKPINKDLFEVRFDALVKRVRP